MIRGRKLAYPSGLTLKYLYTALGYLQKITDNGSGAAYWTADARDAEMHLTSAVAGSGVTTTQAFDPNTGLVQSILAGSRITVTLYEIGRADLRRGWS